MDMESPISKLWTPLRYRDVVNLRLTYTDDELQASACETVPRILQRYG